MRRLLRSSWQILAALVIVAAAFGVRMAYAQDASSLVKKDVSLTQGAVLINEGSILDECATNSDTTYCWVNDVWSVMRQLSNIMILLFLFISAAATTLNLQVGTYGIKRMLPSVITGTLLANFSREISNILMSVEASVRIGLLSFIKSSAGASGAQLSWSSLATPINYAVESIKPTTDVTSILGGLLFIVLAAAGVLALLLLVLLFVVRKLFLGFLIVLAPLAFLAMAAPFSQGVFRKWWSEYIKWMFMPTISVFFIVIGSIITAIVAKTGFSLIAFIASLGSIYLAIKAPFAMSGMVGAAAGFIAGNTWGRMKGSVKENALLAAHKTPFVGASIRALSKAGDRRKAALKDYQSGPIKRMHANRVLPKGANAAQRLWHNIASTAAQADNFIANGRRGWWFRGVNIGSVKADKAVADSAGWQAVRQKEIENGLLEEDSGYKARVGALTAAEESVEMMLKGLKNEATASALTVDNLTRRERELARQRSAAGEGIKKIAERRLALEGEDENSATGRFVRSRLDRMAREQGFTREGAIGSNGLPAVAGNVGAMLSTVGDQARDLEDVMTAETKKKQVLRSRRTLRNHTRAGNLSRMAPAALTAQLGGMSAADWDEMGTQMIDSLVQDGSITPDDAIALRQQARTGPTSTATRQRLLQQYTATGGYATDQQARRGNDNRGAFFKRAQKAVGEANQVGIDLSAKNLDRDQREGMVTGALQKARMTTVNAATGVNRRDEVVARILTGNTHYDGSMTTDTGTRLSATAWDEMVGDVLPHIQSLHSNIVALRPSAASDIREIVQNFLEPAVNSGATIPGIDAAFITRAGEIATALETNNPAAAGFTTPTDVRSAAKQLFGTEVVQRAIGARGEVAKIMGGE